MGDEPADAPKPAPEPAETGAGEPAAPPAEDAAGRLPPAAPVEFERRHPKALQLELAIGGAVQAVLTLTALLVASVLVFGVGLPSWIFVPALGLPLALVFPLLVFPRWRHRRYSYRADDRGLEIRSGIWWRSHRFIPYSRLQHTDLAQGPLERQFGLANLVVHTAGTHEARTTLSGLALERARQLRAQLTDAGGAAGAETDGV